MTPNNVRMIFVSLLLVLSVVAVGATPAATQSASDVSETTEADLTIEVNDSDGSYDRESVTLTIEAAADQPADQPADLPADLPALPGEAGPPQNNLAEGDLRDNVNGDVEDGEQKTDIFDVQLLYEAQNKGYDVVTQNPELFDFDGDGGDEVDVFDVQALFELTA